MNMRLLPIAGLTGLVSIALASSAVAGGGGWPPAPGNYRQSDTSAFASLSGPPTTVITPGKGGGPGPSDFAYVGVDRGLHTFKPKSGPGLVQQSGTMLTLDLFTASGGYTSGCWIIADRDFVVATDLSSASLSTTVPAASNCPGSPLNVSALNGVTGKGGGGGGGGAPVTLNLSWTYNGVISHSQDNGVLRCGSFQTTAHYDDDHASASAQGQISGATGTMTSDYSSIDKSAYDQVVNGVPADACF